MVTPRPLPLDVPILRAARSELAPSHARPGIEARQRRASRRVLLALACGLAAAAPGGAATTVPGGTIATSTTWSPAGSPYVVQGAVTVGAGATLTVGAGVQVRFAIGTELNVLDGASLVAQGSAGQPIAFTSDAASPARGDWYYIRAFAGAHLRLTHCEVAWAGRGNYSALVVYATDTEIRNCRIHDNAFRAVHLDGAGLAPLLADTQIQSNGEIAVFQTTVDMTPTYQGVSMSGNGTDAVVIPGGAVHRAVTIDGSPAALSGASPLITGTITVAGDGALTITPGTTLRFAYSTQLDVLDGGWLTAQGTLAAGIAFTSAASPQQRGDWYYLRAFAGAHVRLSHLDLAYAGRGNYSALIVYATDTAITDSRIHDNASTGVQLEGAGLAPSLADTRIDHNGGAALYQGTINMAPALHNLTFDGNATDALVIAAPSVTTDVTVDGAADILNGAPVVLTGSLAVQNGGHLTIAPGTTIAGPAAYQIDVIGGGALLAEGTAAEPIVLGPAGAAPAVGLWYHLRAFAGSTLRLAHVDLGYAGRGNYASLWVMTSDAEVRDCRIHHGASTGVQLEGAGLTPTLADLSIDHNGGVALYQTTINMAPVLTNLSLTENGSDALLVGSPSVTSSVVLDGSADILGGAPIRIGGSLAVQAGASLTVAPGTTLRLPLANSVDVIGGGTLLAEGTTAEPIVIVPDTATPAAGDIYYLRAFAGATLRLAHLDLGYGGRGNYPSLWLLTSDAQVRDSRIHHGASTGVQLDGVGLTPALAGVTIDHNGGAALYQTTINMAPSLAAVTLADNGRDVLMMPGGTVDRAVTLDGGAATIGGKPVVLTGSLTVGAAGALTIAAGTTVRLPMAADFVLVGGGTLIGDGSAAAPVVLVSDAATPQPGDWYRLLAQPGSHLRLTHVDLSAAGRGNYPALQLQSTDVSLANCRFHDNAYDGIQTTGDSYPRMADNHVLGNAFGVRNNNAASWVDARFTWWGDPSGPYHPILNAGGKGNAVSDRVLFVPWLEDESGTVSTRLITQIVGPSRVSPGETVDYAVSYYAGSAVSDAVLVVTLPVAGEFETATGGGLYWPQRHQVFWRLGDLAVGGEGFMSFKVSFSWGLPNGKDKTLAVLAGVDAGAAAFDVAAYLSYEQPWVSSSITLTSAELTAERAAHPELDQLYAAATAQGFRLAEALRMVLNADSPLTQVRLFRPEAGSYMSLRSDGEDVYAVTYDRTAMTVSDAGGGMSLDLQTYETASWGSWAPGATDLSTPAATPPLSGLSAPPEITRDQCFKNCAMKTAALMVPSLVSKKIAFVMAIPECWQCGRGSATACGKCAAAIAQMASEKLEKGFPILGEVISLYECNRDCKDPAKRAQYVCTQPLSLCAGMSVSLWGRARPVFLRWECNQNMGMWSLYPIPHYCNQTEECVPGYVSSDGTPCYNCWLDGPPPRRPIAAAAAVCARLAETGAGCCSFEGPEVRRAKDPNEKFGPSGDVLPGQLMSYRITYENEGAGRAFGVFVVDELGPHLDETTVELAGNGTFYPDTRTIIWTVGELAPKGEDGSKGEVSFTARLKSGLPGGTVVTNQATVYFPSVPEETPTNTVVNVVAPVAAAPQHLETQAATAVGITLAASDVSGAPLTFAIAEPPLYGSLTGTPPVLTYTPAAGFVGQDRFTFTAGNGVSTSRAADVTIDVTPSASDHTPPEVRWTEPGADATLADLPARPFTTDDVGPLYAPALLVQLSEALDPATVSEQTVLLVDAAGRPVPRTVRFDGATNEIVVTLRQAWRPTRYTVTLTAAVEDAAGNPLAAPYTWSFTARPPGTIRERVHSEP